jgi:multiple sugar transport system substrate-binding protein
MKSRFLTLGMILACSILMFLTCLYVQQPITLTLGVFAGSNWDVPSPESSKIIDRAIKRFEKKYPNVKIEYESGIVKDDYTDWLSQKALEGNLPDVFMVLSDDLTSFANVGMLESLDTWILKDSDFDTSKYFSTSLSSGTVNSIQYTLPYESVPTLMFVNKTLLESSGIELPSDDWTWDDFYSICSQIIQDTDGDGVLDQFGEYGYSWENALSSNSMSVFDENGTTTLLEDERAYEAIEFVRKLEGLNQGQTVTSEMFDKGLVAFCPMRFSEYRTYKPYPWSVKKYSSFEWDCMPMPAGPSGSNVSELETLLCGMSANSSHKELAWEFLKMLSYNDQTQESLFKYSQGVSVLKDVSTSDTVTKYIAEDAPREQSYNLDFFDEMMEHALIVKKFNGYDQVYSIADSEIRRLIGTDEEIPKAIDDLSDELNIALKQN